MEMELKIEMEIKNKKNPPRQSSWTAISKTSGSTSSKTSGTTSSKTSGKAPNVSSQKQFSVISSSNGQKKKTKIC